MTKKRTHVWVVEWESRRGNIHPVQSEVSLPAAREALEGWHETNPDDRFGLRKYVPASKKGR